MAPIAASVTKQSTDTRLGIGLINSTAGAPVTISSIASDGLFANSGLTTGMQVLSINNIASDGLTSGQAVQMLKDAIGQVLVIADNPIQAAVVASTSAPAILRGKKRGYIILKKTFKYMPSGIQMATRKSYSFHGPMTQDMVDYVNSKLQGLRLSHGANKLQFSLDNFGHFLGPMNHEAQKHYEEDFVVIILEAMEVQYHFYCS